LQTKHQQQQQPCRHDNDGQPTTTLRDQNRCQNSQRKLVDSNDDGDERSKTVEISHTPPPPSCVVASSGACHCLPRGLRRKSPATAVISRGRSVVSSPLDRRGPGDPAITPPPLTCSTPAAVLPRRESRPDLVQISTNEHDSTSGPEGDSTFGLDNVSTSGSY